MRPPVSEPSETRWKTLALGVVVFATRLPFLFDGYGADTDAWRVIWTGHQIAHTGTYLPSRAPGNPIPELVAAALNGSPVWVMNGITATLSAVCAVLFAQLLRRLGCRAWVAGALALAGTPVVWIHSTDSMDYVWALALVLGAWRLAIDRRWALAGALVGLATGCRMTSIGMLAPLTVLALGAPPDRVRGDVARLWAAGIVTGVIAFSPVIVVSGPGFLRAYEHGYPHGLYVVKNLTVDVWGVLGFAILAIAGLAAAWRRIPVERSELPAASRPMLAAAATAVLVEVAVFFRLPHDAAYLIPAVPFALLLLARGLPHRAFLAACAGVCLSALVLKVSEPGTRLPTGAPSRAGVFRLGSHAFDVDARGPVLTDRERRKSDLDFARRARARALRIDGPAVIVAQEWLPYLRVFAGASRERAVDYVYMLDEPALDSLRLARVPVYDLPGAELYAETVGGYDLRKGGSRPLDVP